MDKLYPVTSSAMVWSFLYFTIITCVVSFRTSNTHVQSFNAMDIRNNKIRSIFHLKTPPLLKCKSKTGLSMAFDTIVSVGSNFESKCTLESDKGISLTNYMQLPVEQYVCIKMPLDATLTRIDANKFNLTVPPVRFFNLDVSPTLICYVTQTNEAVVIESTECQLRGSPYVVGLNGCFKMKIKTVFKWIDGSLKRSILSSSNIYVEVDPPPPFKYFSKSILESTGSLAMSIALRQIENAFVSSLSRDYEKWATNKNYRDQRSGLFEKKAPAIASTVNISRAAESPSSSEIIRDDIAVQKVKKSTELQSDSAVDPSPSSASIPVKSTEIKVSESTIASETSEALQATVSPAVTTINASVAGDFTYDGPEVISDDICLVPGEPIVRIEDAPSNSRRIFTGIDIMATVDDVWEVLTNYEDLGKVVPSLVKNEVVFRTADGGARLSQVGGAKVLPGVTFTAKTVLDVKVYTENNPIPSNMVATYVSSSRSPETAKLQISKSQPLKRDLFPRPYAITSLPHRDITMQNVLGEGDFEHYQGIWRVQSLPNCAVDGSDASRLTYAVEIKPKGILPVSLIESRIATDLKANLEAIRKFVESRPSKSSVLPSTPKVPAEMATSSLPSVVNVSEGKSGTSSTELCVETQPVGGVTETVCVIAEEVVSETSEAPSSLSSESISATTSSMASESDVTNTDSTDAEEPLPFSFRRFFGFSKSESSVSGVSDKENLQKMSENFSKLQSENKILEAKVATLEAELETAMSIISQIKAILRDQAKE